MSDHRSLTLYPYLLNGSCWVFDDQRTGLKAEAFVCGISEMISRVVEAKGIPDTARGFAMTFAAEPFPDHDVELHWIRPDPTDGNWYEGTVVGEPMEGWLCPALLLYFEHAPPRIFVRCDPLPAGIDPIWNPKPGETARRFVEAPQASDHGGTAEGDREPRSAEIVSPMSFPGHRRPFHIDTGAFAFGDHVVADLDYKTVAEFETAEDAEAFVAEANGWDIETVRRKTSSLARMLAEYRENLIRGSRERRTE
jgi:hypothetical protein